MGGGRGRGGDSDGDHSDGHRGGGSLDHHLDNLRMAIEDEVRMRVEEELARRGCGGGEMTGGRGEWDQEHWEGDHGDNHWGEGRDDHWEQPRGGRGGEMG